MTSCLVTLLLQYHEPPAYEGDSRSVTSGPEKWTFAEQTEMIKININFRCIHSEDCGKSDQYPEYAAQCSGQPGQPRSFGLLKIGN
jgi:hypothetical protein